MNQTELEIKSMIRDLKRVNIDTLEYEKELENLINYNTSSNKQVAEAVLKFDKALRFTELKSRISVYLPYLEFYKIIEYLEKGEPTLEERIELCTKLLTTIGSKDDMVMSSDKLLKRAYKLIYKTIKQEIKETLFSKIFDIVVTSDFDKLCLGEIVREDIENIMSQSFVEKLDELNSLRSENMRFNIASPSNYVTLPLIIKIVKIESHEELHATINSALNKISQKLGETNNSCVFSLDVNNLKNKSLDTLSEFLNSLESCKLDIKKRMVSLLLTASLLSGVCVGGTELLKRIFTKDYYETTKVTTVMDETIHEPIVDTYYDTLVEEKERLILDVYSKASLLLLYREHNDYYLKDVIKETDLEYLTIDLESPKVTQRENYSYEFYTTSEIERYSGEIRKLYRIIQAETPEFSEYLKGQHIFACIILCIILIAVGFIPYFPINDVIKIIKDLKTFDEKDTKYSELVLKLRSLLNECMTIISESEELTSIYNKILESGLLEKDDEDFIKEIEDLIVEIKSKKDNIYKDSKQLSDLEGRYLKLKK